MTTVSRVDGKIISYVKGSPECVFSMCSVEPAKRDEIQKYIRQAQEKSMRIIAFGHKELSDVSDIESEEYHREMESDMVFDGFVAISDPLRADVYEAVKSCRAAGVALKILTGDNIYTAKAIADELHLMDEGHIAVES